MKIDMRQSRIEGVCNIDKWSRPSIGGHRSLTDKLVDSLDEGFELVCREQNHSPIRNH